MTNQDSLENQIDKFGNLAEILRTEFKEIDSPLTAIGFDESPLKGSKHWARVEKNGRSSEIATSLDRTCVSAQFWNQGVCLCSLQTPSPKRMCLALHHFIVGHLTADELKADFSEIIVDDSAHHYEKGSREYVDYKWRQLLDHLNNSDPQLHSLAELAFQTEVLNKLLPYVSMGSLSFSRCTEYPFSYDYPSVRSAGSDLYQISSSDGKSIGESNASIAIELIIQNLPNNCG